MASVLLTLAGVTASLFAQVSLMQPSRVIIDTESFEHAEGSSIQVCIWQNSRRNEAKAYKFSYTTGIIEFVIVCSFW